MTLLFLSGVPVSRAGAQQADILVGGRAARLVFNDEFNEFFGTPLGTARGRPTWQTRYFYGARTLLTNHETQYFSDQTTGIDPFRVADGTLTITAAPAGGLPNGATYSSGLITTHASFRPTYGYFEIRAKLPSGAGMWPAFWLLPADGAWPPEIDVFEALGSAPDMVFTTVHSAASKVHLQKQAKVAVSCLTSAFHVFAVSWRPDVINWYVDGNVVFSNPTPPDMHKPMYLLIGLAVGGDGSWPGKAQGETASLMIDYVRGYQYLDLAPGGGQR